MEKILKNINREMANKHLVEGEEIEYTEAEKLIKNPESFAKRIETNESEPQEGLFLTQETVELGEGHFTNKYDLRFNADENVKPNIITGSDFFYQHRVFHPQNRHAVRYGTPAATINGPFFFLQDEAIERSPKELMYNLNIREGKVVGLPSTTREALFVGQDNRLRAERFEAKGTIDIGGQNLEWIGAEPFAHGRLSIDERPDKALLYNSACCTIAYDNLNDKRSLRRVRWDLNQTPIVEDFSDVVVNVDPANGELYVSAINKGGGTDFFEGVFILQVNELTADSITTGSPVDPKTLSGIDLKSINSAITVGPSVKHFKDNTDHEINHDQSLGTFPPFAPDRRYARSIAFEDKDGFVHFTVLDAVPRSEHMKGVTPQEATKLIPDDAKWAVFLDGGQSSRFTYADKDGEVHAKGNTQYLRLHEKHKSGQAMLDEGGEHQYLWSRRGRPVPSIVSVHFLNQDSRD